MDRREMLQRSGALLAAGALNATLANDAWAMDERTANGMLPLSISSRVLPWHTTPQDMAMTVRNIGSNSVALMSGANPVDASLLHWANGLRAHGVDVTMIVIPGDADAEAVLDTAAQLGIRHYQWDGYRHDDSKPYWAQLHALKPKVEAIARLNEKYAMKAMIWPSDTSAGAFFDLYNILKHFDPRLVSFQLDANHLMHAVENGWVGQLRLGAPYIGGLVWMDGAVNCKQIAQTLKEIEFSGPMVWEPGHAIALAFGAPTRARPAV
jgi:hypothetical protein